jgi:thioredoxin 1
MRNGARTLNMRIGLRIAGMLLVAGLASIAVDCTAEGNASGNTRPMFGKKRPNYKVTFMEFGSVVCARCKMMRPVLDTIESVYAGRVKVVFFDVLGEAGSDTMQAWGVKSIPTQVFLDSAGKEFYRHRGFYPVDSIVCLLRQRGLER